MNYEELLKRAKESLPHMEKEETRLEIPEPVVQPLGRQTIVKNFSEIAKAVRRDASHIAKFPFKELAVPGSIKGNEIVLQGKVSFSMISQRINDYVKEFVLCHECGKPDTMMQKSGRIFSIKCEACGAKKSVRNI